MGTTKNSFWTTRATLLALSIGCVMTLLIYGLAILVCAYSTRRAFEYEANALSAKTADALETIQCDAAALRLFFDYSQFVDRDEYMNFTRSIFSNSQSVHKVLWIPKIVSQDRNTVESRARSDGLERFQIVTQTDTGTIPAAAKPCYWPILYEEPYAGNQSICGYDISNEPVFETILNKAIASDQAVLMAKKTFFTPDENANRLWLALPVYRSDGIRYTKQGRRDSLKGFLITLFDIDKLIENCKEQSSAGIKLTIWQQADYGQPELICQPRPSCNQTAQQPRWNLTVARQIADRTLLFESASDDFKQHGVVHYIPWLVWPIGAVFNGLLILYLRQQYHKNEYAQRLVEEKTLELKLQIEKSDQMAFEAAKANRSKSEFLAAMSHDIRTPMDAILGFSSLLKESEIPPECRCYVDIIHDSGQQLLLLINDILDLSRIESGKLHLAKGQCQLRPMLGHIDRLLRISATNKGLDFQVHIEPGVPERLVIDERRLLQCLVNLLSNAIKFTSKGFVCLTIRKEDADLVFEVVDTGIGIPECKHKAIFEPFTHTRQEACSQETGLGLAISRQLVEMMGGTIQVSSTIGQGSTFQIRLPLASVIQAEYQAEKPTPAAV